MQIVYEIRILDRNCIKTFIFKKMVPFSKLFLLELGLTLIQKIKIIVLNKDGLRRGFI